jgi:hypothetical protein
MSNTVSVVQSLFNGSAEIATWSQALDYPASGTAIGDTIYSESVRTGVENLRVLVEQVASECTYSNIVLVGYSQGAHVIGDVLEGTTSLSLSQNARNHIMSVAFFGDPTFRGGEAINAAGSGTGNGLFPRAAGALADWTTLGYPTPDTVEPVPVPIIRSWCFTGDTVCQRGAPGEGIDIHGSYASTVTYDAYVFLKSFIYDTSRRANGTPIYNESRLMAASG